MIDKEIHDKMFSGDIDTPILELYKGVFDNCFIVLHPFYKTVFTDEFDFLRQYEITHQLITPRTWESILFRTQIENNSRLALAITYLACNKHFKSLAQEDRNKLDLIKESNIIEPYWQDDKIPEDIIDGIIKLKKMP